MKYLIALLIVCSGAVTHAEGAGDDGPYAGDASKPWHAGAGFDWGGPYPAPSDVRSRCEADLDERGLIRRTISNIWGWITNDDGFL